MSLRSLLPLAASLLLFAACGGARPGGCFPAHASLDAGLAGTVTEDGQVQGDGLILLGDTDLDVASRGVLRFSLAGLPDDAVIHGVRLHVHLLGSQGTPHLDLSDLLVEQIDLGDALDARDFASAARWTGLLSDTAGSGRRVVDLTEAVRAAHAAGETTIDLRIGFAVPTDRDGSVDRILLNDPGDAAAATSEPGTVPYLEITYGGC